MRISLLSLCLAFTFITSAQTFRWDTDQTTNKGGADPSNDQIGYAVYYADYYEGNPTALGEIFHQNLMTAAHQKLPLGTIVKITRIDNGRSTTVRINDRGAYCDDCVIDLSKAAAREIDLLRVGRTRVSLTVVGFSNENPPSKTAPATSYTATNYNNTTTPSSYSYPAPASYNAPTAQKPRFTARGGQVNPYNTEVARPRTYNSPQTQANVQPRSIPSAVTPTPSSSSKVSIITDPISAYAVQLASYGNFANAERHVLSLQDKGFNNVFVFQDQRRDGSLINRVIVAPFNDSGDAQNYLRDLRTYQEMEGLVIRM